METFFAGLKSKQLAFLLLCVIAVSCIGAGAEANSVWRDMKGHSECGGIDKNGELQEPCGFTRASKIGKAVGTCPKGSFFDVGTWSCYSCPSSYNRNARAVNRLKQPTETIAENATRSSDTSVSIQMRES